MVRDPTGSEMTEPDITVNGTPLSFGQAMTLRVALNSFCSELGENGLGDDAHGRSMTRNYLDRAAEVLRLMHRAPAA